MRRRNWLALTAVMASTLAVGTGIAVAASGKGAAVASVIKLNCKLSLTTTPPPGDNAVAQPPGSGNQYGPIHCRPAVLSLFGGGIVADAFTVPDSGDTVGTFTEYFKTGSVSGMFDITPLESDFSATSFSSQTWQGTVKVKSGTGIYKGIKEKKVGTMTCTSPDSVHLTCSEKIKLKTL